MAPENTNLSLFFNLQAINSVYAKFSFLEAYSLMIYVKGYNLRCILYFFKIFFLCMFIKEKKILSVYK